MGPPPALLTYALCVSSPHPRRQRPERFSLLIVPLRFPLMPSPGAQSRRRCRSKACRRRHSSNPWPECALGYMRLPYWVWGAPRLRRATTPRVLTLATRSVPRRRSPRSRHISKEDAAMYPYSIEELAWAAARAIKEEVRQTRSGSVEKEDASKSAPWRRLS